MKTYEIIELIINKDTKLPLELNEWEVLSRADDGEEVSYVLRRAIK